MQGPAQRFLTSVQWWYSPPFSEEQPPSYPPCRHTNSGNLSPISDIKNIKARTHYKSINPLLTVVWLHIEVDSRVPLRSHHSVKIPINKPAFLLLPLYHLLCCHLFNSLQSIFLPQIVELLSSAKFVFNSLK